MKRNNVSTRRVFLQNAGSVLSVPLVVGGAEGAAVASRRPEEPGDDRAAIRRLHQDYAASINAGRPEAVAVLFTDPSAARVEEGIRGVSADRFTGHEVIRFAEDGMTATVAIHCTVRTETGIEGSSTLIEMARQQGEGFLSRWETRVLETACVKREGVWKLARAVFRSESG